MSIEQAIVDGLREYFTDAQRVANMRGDHHNQILDNITMTEEQVIQEFKSRGIDIYVRAGSQETFTIIIKIDGQDVFWEDIDSFNEQD